MTSNGPIPQRPGALSFAEVDVAIISWLADKGFESVSTDGPDQATSWPHIQATVIPAGEATLYLNSSTVDVEVFHPDYNAAANAARVVHDWLLALAGVVVGTQCIDDVRGSTMGFQDYDDQNLTRFMSTYTVDSRPINPL